MPANDGFVLTDMLNRFVLALNKGDTDFTSIIRRGGERVKDKWHMSDSGKCHRMRVLKRIGVIPEPKSALSLRRFLMGDLVEDMVCSAVRWCIKHVTDYKDFKVQFQRTLSHPLFDAVGHPDIEMTYPTGEMVVWDIKSCHSDKIDYVKSGSKDIGYFMQESAYRSSILLLGERCDATATFYVDKDTLRTHPEPTPEQYMDEVASDYATLNNEYRHFQRTREVPEEIPMVTERERYPKRKRMDTPRGEGRMPVWSCDPRYCDFLKNCPKIKSYYDQCAPRSAEE